MTNKYMKRYLTSGNGNQNHNNITSYLPEYLLSKRQILTNVGENIKKSEPSYIDGRIVK